VHQQKLRVMYLPAEGQTLVEEDEEAQTNMSSMMMGAGDSVRPSRSQWCPSEINGSSATTPCASIHQRTERQRPIRFTLLFDLLLLQPISAWRTRNHTKSTSRRSTHLVLSSPLRRRRRLYSSVSLNLHRHLHPFPCPCL
jgi:hypothetical protein